MNVSIVISTYNRADLLRRTLLSLREQLLSFRDTVELLVVDNNSSDNTKEVVEEFTGGVPARYVREEEQGLASARNRGVREARGAAVLFTDDDIRYESGWLTAYLDAIEAHSHAGFFGGRILPDWSDRPRPTWLQDERMPLLSGVLGCHDLGDRTIPYTPGDPTPFGASFAVRRALFSELGGFRGDLGVKGTFHGRGEDSEFLSRAQAAGESGIYVGEALCWHWVEPDRLAVGKLFEHGVAKGRSHLAMTGSAPCGSLFEAAGYLVRGLRQFLLGRGDRFRQCIINAGIQIGMRGPH